MVQNMLKVLKLPYSTRRLRYNIIHVSNAVKVTTISGTAAANFSR